MSDLKRRFDEEMRHLLGAGREFAREHAALAQKISIDDVARRHPYLEQLFENFAFQVARARTDLEDADDDTAGELLDLVAHGLEIPLPSVAIVEFVPGAGTTGTAERILAGSEVRAWPADHPSQIRATVAGNCPVHQLRLDFAKLLGGSQGRASLEFVLASVGGAGTASWPAELEIFLGRDPLVAWTIRHFLLRRTGSVEVEGRAAAVRFQASKAAGYGTLSAPACEPLLDLRDFLCAEERFRYVRLVGLDAALPATATTARIAVRFQGVLPKDLEPLVDKNSLRLNTAPVVNAHLHEFDPLLVDPRRASYPLEARGEPGKEVLDLASMAGASQSDPTRTHAYLRSWESRHAGVRIQESGSIHLRRRPNRSGGARTSFRLSHRDPAFFFPDEFLSGNVWCCDGDVPSEKVRAQDLSDPGPGVPSGWGVAGLTRPTQVFRPPADPMFRWRMLSHFQGSFRDMLQADSLKETLRALLWDTRGLRRGLVDGIRQVESVPGHVLVDGIPNPVWEIRILWEDSEVKPDSWERLGRLDAFAQLLLGLFRSRTPAGVESRVSFRVEPAGIRLEHG
ncbi:MAG TPA: type VI secretion system baseplate subunit TssF [Fibrobacteria bacterium]|nr:type VI secretion system baseplate subunit TssF [Fibrobacteria bacterium]